MTQSGHRGFHVDLTQEDKASLRYSALPSFKTLICLPVSRNAGVGMHEAHHLSRGFAVGSALEYNFTTLRISRAYVSLLSRSEGDAKAISLAWIGDYEIRMHAAPPSAVEQPLFIVDIFDHDARIFVDSRACHSLAEGAIAFEEFLFMAEPVVGGPPH
jgi:hypothetical protein